MNPVHQNLQILAERALPRMLTQVCRDPNSACHGCWDRNWWHYKIRDFPSVILQQGGYALHVAAGTSAATQAEAAFLQDLARASALFWNERAKRHGAFEEYYPYEQGYPPLAFSTLAVAKLAKEGVIDPALVQSGLETAARQLTSRFEAQAANQQVAGTAALAVIRRISPDTVDENDFQALLQRSLDLQHEDGWFPEYDGPDLGYLSVTMDCLWDIYDATEDPRCLDAIGRGLEFIAWFTQTRPHGAGMHNSRNTDYIVPYAIARLAANQGPKQDLAHRVLHRLYANAADPSHFLGAVDDRYWCHYIGHSLFRSLRALDKQPLPPLPGETASSSGNSMASTGHYRLNNHSMEVLISAHKGGILTASTADGALASDFGWIVRRGGQVWVSHWWSTHWSVKQADQSLTVEGPMVCHKEHLSSPFKHVILRGLSFLFGRRMIGILKNMLIFRKGADSLRFQRTIQLRGDELLVEDSIIGTQSSDRILRAPRSSKRHVASADSHHPEDASLLAGFHREEKTSDDSERHRVVTKLRPHPTLHSN